MKKLEKLNLETFEATELNDSQKKSVFGATQIKTGETGGTDSNTWTSTTFPLRNDGDTQNDPILYQ